MSKFTPQQYHRVMSAMCQSLSISTADHKDEIESLALAAPDLYKACENMIRGNLDIDSLKRLIAEIDQ